MFESLVFDLIEIALKRFQAIFNVLVEVVKLNASCFSNTIPASEKLDIQLYSIMEVMEGKLGKVIISSLLKESWLLSGFAWQAVLYERMRNIPQLC